MKITLNSNQRFIIPLENEYNTYLLVKEIDFIGDKGDHNIPQIHYIGTKIDINLKTEDVAKEDSYTLVIDEIHNVEYGKIDD